VLACLTVTAAFGLVVLVGDGGDTRALLSRAWARAGR
jgi:hypothetical protein